MSKICHIHRSEELPCPQCAKKQMAEFFPVCDANLRRNARVQARYDELQREGKHGHYETMFQVVREEIERVIKAIGT